MCDLYCTGYLEDCLRCPYCERMYDEEEGGYFYACHKPEGDYEERLKEEAEENEEPLIF